MQNGVEGLQRLTPSLRAIKYDKYARKGTAMHKEEIEEQIRQWQERIEKYNSAINKNNREIEELEIISARLSRKAEEIESSLDSTLSKIRNKLGVIYGCEKFKTNYSERVKAILHNSSTYSAISETREAITRMHSECYRLDDNNDALCSNINYANQQIEQLRAQLRTEMMNCE